MQMTKWFLLLLKSVDHSFHHVKPNEIFMNVLYVKTQILVIGTFPNHRWKHLYSKRSCQNLKRILFWCACNIIMRSMIQYGLLTLAVYWCCHQILFVPTIIPVWLSCINMNRPNVRRLNAPNRLANSQILGVYGFDWLSGTGVKTPYN